MRDLFFSIGALMRGFIYYWV